MGRLSCAQTSGVWGTRSKERMARIRISADRMGNSSRATAVYHSDTSGCAASHPMACVNSCKQLPPFRLLKIQQ